MLRDFKPAFLFLAKFLGIYLFGNIVYGVFVESFNNHPDPITTAVTFQTSTALNICGYITHAEINPDGPTVFVKTNNKIVINVFEGCNGLNVMIIFIAFVYAFGGPLKTMTWFIPMGLLVIHAFNILRIGLLYFLAQNRHEFFYYIHKYIFTAVLYLIVLCLWVIWVFGFNANKKRQ